MFGGRVAIGLVLLGVVQCLAIKEGNDCDPKEGKRGTVEALPLPDLGLNQEGDFLPNDVCVVKDIYCDEIGSPQNFRELCASIRKNTEADNEKVRELLEEYPALINERGGKHKVTPLHVATSAGNLGAIRMLLRLGAKLEAKTRGGHTPLDGAVIEGHINAVGILLKAGAMILRPKGETNALELAEICRRKNLVALLTSKLEAAKLREEESKKKSDSDVGSGDENAAEDE